MVWTKAALTGILSTITIIFFREMAKLHFFQQCFLAKHCIYVLDFRCANVSGVFVPNFGALHTHIHAYTYLCSCTISLGVYKVESYTGEAR